MVRKADVGQCTETSRRARLLIWSGHVLQSTWAIRPCQRLLTSSASGSGCSLITACTAETTCFPASSATSERRKKKLEFGHTLEGWSSCSRASLMALVMSSLVHAFCLHVHQSATCGRPVAQKCVEVHCVQTFVWRSEYEQVFDPALLECPGNMVHQCLSNIRTQDHCQDVHWNVYVGQKPNLPIDEHINEKQRKKNLTVFDEVVFRQTLQACSTCKALWEYDIDGGSKSFPLFWLPPVDILQKCWEWAVLERFLEVLVSSSWCQFKLRWEKQQQHCIHLLISLLRTLTNFFISLISAGALIWKREKKDVGPSASRYELPGWRRLPTMRMLKRVLAYLRKSNVDLAWMSLFATAL